MPEFVEEFVLKANGINLQASIMLLHPVAHHLFKYVTGRTLLFFKTS
jgi:hypothetical protein